MSKRKENNGGRREDCKNCDEIWEENGYEGDSSNPSQIGRFEL